MNRIEQYSFDTASTPNYRSNLETETRIKYLSGKINIDQAISTVSGSSAFGDFYAGQWLIEKASELPEPLAIKQTILLANQSFKNSIAKELENTSGKPNSVITLARFFNTHLPIYASIFTNSSLPDQQLAENVYDKSIKIGYDLSRQYASMTEINQREKRKTLICLSKIAINTLLERHTITENMTRYWFPMIATISARSINKTSFDANEILDIEILENQALYGYQNTENNPIVIASGIHVNHRTIRPEEGSRLYIAPNKFINRVDIFPDLILHGTHNSNIPSDIIEDCIIEKFHHNQSIRGLATSRLNARTDLLLGVLSREID